MKKEMEYQKERIITLLYTGTYKNYKYIILSLGTHPTAYVEIPKNHKYYRKEYRDCDIGCHGGLTYSGNDYWNIETCEESNRWFLGWDYAHCDDWVGYYEEEFNIRLQNKKWTTDEIIEECKNVIEQLLRGENEET